MPQSQAIKCGSIVWAEVSSPQDGTTKLRPVVILTPTADIAPDGAVVGAAITTTLLGYPAAKYFDLPWSADGRSTTGLRRKSVAVLNWLVKVRVSEIKEVRGHVPKDRLDALILKLSEFAETMKKGESR